MSKEELKRFRKDLRANSELKAKLRQARKKAVRQAAVSFATTAGYSVTVEDFKSGKGKRKADTASAD